MGFYSLGHRGFCKRDFRMMCCLPGAMVRNDSEGAQDILKWESDQPEAVVHFSTNNIDKKTKEVLQREFREICSKLKSRISGAVISGTSEARSRRKVWINAQLTN